MDLIKQVPNSCGATDGTIKNDLNDLFWLFADNLAGVLSFLMSKLLFDQRIKMS
jgi:hypothetical protein